MDSKTLGKEIIKLIDIYVDSLEKEAIYQAMPIEPNRLANVEAYTRFTRATTRLAGHIDHESPEFHEILKSGISLFNKIRVFSLGHKR